MWKSFFYFLNIILKKKNLTADVVKSMRSLHNFVM